MNKRKKVLLSLLILFLALSFCQRRELYDFFAGWEENLEFAADRYYHIRTSRMDFMGIHYVASRGQAEAAKRILEKNPGAADSRDYRGRTPIFKAVKRGSYKTLEVLLSGGADVAARDYLGKTCMDVLAESSPAMSAHRRELVESELSQWRHRRASAEYAELKKIIIAGDLKRLRYSWKKIPPEIGEIIVQKDNERTPSLLKVAAEKGDADICLFLVSLGQDPYRADSRSPSALSRAAKNGHVEAVEALLTNRPSLRNEDAPANDPVMAALKAGRPEVVKTLIRRGADYSAVDEKGRSILHLAVESGMDDLAGFLALKSRLANKKDKGGLTPLFYALFAGKVELARTMIDNRADLGLCDGEMLLIHAAQKGDLKTASFLLDHEDGNYMDIDGQSSLGKTALFAAAEKGEEKVVDFLLSRGSLADARNERDGMTALHEAASLNYLGVVKVLLDKGADVNALDDKAYSPLHYAAANGRLETIEELARRGARLDGSSHGPAQPPPLAFAVSSGMAEAVTLLLDLGAGAVNARLDSEPGGEDQAKLSNASLLHLAVGRRDKDIARTLIEHGADPNAGDCRAEFMGNSHEDITPLQLALLAEREISIDMLETLLEGGDGLEKTDSLGRTALMYAAYGGSKDAIEFLLERGADPDARDRDGRTALHWFAMGPHRYWWRGNTDLEAAKVLLASPAEINAPDNDGNLALHLAANKGDSSLIGILCEHGANPNLRNIKGLNSIHQLSGVDRRIFGECLEALVAGGGDVDARFPDGETFLLKAAKMRNHLAIEELLKAGADVRLKVRSFVIDDVEFKESTFLHLAAAQYDPRLTSALLKTDADVNAPDKDGKTPLHWMVPTLEDYQSDNYLAEYPSLAALLERGADPRRKDNAGKSPLDLARELGNRGLITALEESRGENE